MRTTAMSPALDGVRQPLSSRSFLFVGVVLAVGLLTLAFAFYGPVSWTAAEWLVVQPAERDWGFHAEWRDYRPSPNYEYSLLTVVRVTEGGPFARAGIKPGMALGPWHSASFGPHFGGLYSVFAGARNKVRVRMLDDPNNRGGEHYYDVTR
jgi:hypothetical protein